MKRLTLTQFKVLNYSYNSKQASLRISSRQIAQELGLSDHKSVLGILKTLEKKKYIVIDQRKAFPIFTELALNVLGIVHTQINSAIRYSESPSDNRLEISTSNSYNPAAINLNSVDRQKLLGHNAPSIYGTSLSPTDNGSTQSNNSGADWLAYFPVRPQHRRNFLQVSFGFLVSVMVLRLLFGNPVSSIFAYCIISSFYLFVMVLRNIRR